MGVGTTLLSRRDLLTAGYTDAEVRAALRRRELTRVVTGVYAPTNEFEAMDLDSRYRSRVRAIAERSPALVISHLSAAAMHGLPLPAGRRMPVHLTRPGRGGAHRRDDRRWVHAALLDGTHTVSRDGLPLTSVARTVVDVARTEPLDDAVSVADAALHDGLVSPDELTLAMEDASWSRGRPRAWRALRLADGRAESPGESRMRLRLIPSFPDLTLQVEIFDERGRFVARTDGGLLDDGLLMEYDGHSKYGRLLKPGESVREAVAREKRREELISRLGWGMVRFVSADLDDQDRMTAQVEDARRHRRRLVAAGVLRGSACPRTPVKIEG